MEHDAVARLIALWRGGWLTCWLALRNICIYSTICIAQIVQGRRQPQPFCEKFTGSESKYKRSIIINNNNNKS